MPIIDLSRVINNPMFAQTFGIECSINGDFDFSGKWHDDKEELELWGVVQPATAKELLQVPDGDRVKEVKSFHCTEEMFLTHVVDDSLTTLTGYNAHVSDIAIWKGQKYRLAKRYEWEDYGYYKALGVRMEGV